MENRFKEHLWFIEMAREEALKASRDGEVPVGAVLVSKEGEVLGKSGNRKERLFDPCSHAEVEVLREAGKKLGSWRLEGCRLYVTLEPCVMCMGALVQARIDSLYFGAYDKKSGALSSGFNIHQHRKFNHKFKVFGGLSHFTLSNMLSTFFKQKRREQTN